MLPSFVRSSRLNLSFDAVFYSITDMDAAIVFYRDTLGLPLVSRDYVARFDLEGVLFELVPMPPGSLVPGNANARLCFAVSDLQETLNELHALGVTTTPIKKKHGGKIAFFRDPGGQRTQRLARRFRREPARPDSLRRTSHVEG
jgi:catechol 2,3-dioxygenase-like lactoylglutathione lyase family enzyme